MSLSNVIQLAYGIPGIALYFFVLYAMANVHKDLNNTLIFLFCLMTFSNIVSWVNLWLYGKLSTEYFAAFYHKMLANHRGFLAFHAFLYYHLYFVQILNLLLISFDRIAAIHEKMLEVWEKVWCYFITGAHLLLLGVHVILRYRSMLEIYYGYANGYVFHDISRNENLIQVAVGSGVFVTCFILNCVSGYSLLKKGMGTSTDRNFFIFSCVSNIALPVYLGVICLTFNSTKDIKLNSIYVSSDCVSLSPALVLFLLPSPISKYIHGLLKNWWMKMVECVPAVPRCW